MFNPFGQRCLVRYDERTVRDFGYQTRAFDLCLFLSPTAGQGAPLHLALAPVGIGYRQPRVPIALTPFAYMPPHDVPPLTKVFDAPAGFAAAHNAPPAFADARRRGPIQPAPDMALGRVIRTMRIAQVADVAATRAYAE